MALAPGVYVEEAFSLSLSIRSNATAVPVIIGTFRQTAEVPVAGCIKVNDWLDFTSKFEPVTAVATVKVVSTPPADSEGSVSLAGDYTYTFTPAIAYNYDVLGLAHYFNNGGGYCYLLPGASK